MTYRPSFQDIAHVGHVELFTPKFEESVAFFKNIVGLHESGRSGSSVYLRAWGDYARYTLKLTASPAGRPWPPGISHAKCGGA